jgi:serine phosphatase RsbU (regulator of sigma subunit)
MRDYTIDQLALMPETEAVRRYFGRRNYGFLVWTWPLACLTFFGFFIASAVGGDVLRLAFAAASMAALSLMFFFRAHEAFETSFEAIFGAYLLFVPLGITFMASDHEFRFVFVSSMAPLFLVMTRLRPSILVLVASVYAGVAISWGIASPGAGFDPEHLVPPLITNAMFAGTSMFITRRRRKAFLKDWSHAAHRELERERMREEIADARKIQLAMLPSAPPDVAWLGISSVSIPANEVGGDFYEYFKLDDERVVIAVGDVAGHGVASGLVLAGIKSGLHLLRDELEHPVGAVERLNRLASEWLQWRMLVTLLIAVVDRRESVVRVVCAGHPPLLVVRGTECHEVGNPALPLGTRLDPVFEESNFDIRPGDTLLAYTDGVTELTNESGDVYGEERLKSILLESASSQTSAEAIRQPILSNISWFKDKAQQLDDLSLVVARLR